MKLVFLAGPFRGDGSEAAKQERVEKARQYALSLIEAGISFYSPHLNLSQLLIPFGSSHEEYAIKTQKEFLERTDVLAVLPGWEESSGTKDEIQWAQDSGMPIVYLEKEGSITKLKELTA